MFIKDLGAARGGGKRPDGLERRPCRARNEAPKYRPMGNAHYPGTPRGAPAGLRAVAGVALACLLAGCAGRERVRAPAPAPRLALPAAWPRNAPADPAAANAVLMRALSLVGTPYRFGGNTPEAGFDCSGLVSFVYRDVLDRSLPRTTADLARSGPRVSPTGLAAGDLVVFAPGGRVSHVGIYVGEGRFVHAPSSGGTVRLDTLAGAYWRDHFDGGRRLLGPQPPSPR
jgi:cell wall-associated NlpC family hydrolase